MNKPNTKTQEEIEKYIREQIYASHRMALKAFQEQGHYEYYNGYEEDEIKFILSLLNQKLEHLAKQKDEELKKKINGHDYVYLHSVLCKKCNEPELRNKLQGGKE